MNAFCLPLTGGIPKINICIYIYIYVCMYTNRPSFKMNTKVTKATREAIRGVIRVIRVISAI